MSATLARLSLRTAGPEDEAFLHRVYAGVREEELAVVPWTDAERDAFLAQQFDAQDAYYRQHYEAAAFDVIEFDGVPVGRLYVARWDEEIRVIDIALLPAHRGRGIGTALLGELVAESDATGKRLTIHVERYNRALELYRRLGFSVVDDLGVYLFLARSPGAS
jgi:ribosomal protein S18 acetylase RimI-like enzyme